MISMNDPKLTPEVVAFAKANGYTHARMLDDGRVTFLLLTITAAQIGIGGMTDIEGVSDRYSYADVPTAVRAYDAWLQRECSGEPEGWVRHQPSNRRRRYIGPDAEMQEYSAP